MSTGKVTAICGKICSGKTHYAKKLMAAKPAVLLSCDELMTTLFHHREGEHHDHLVQGCKTYLLNKSLQILHAGCDVILDWGFWQKSDREALNRFFAAQGIAVQWHCITLSDEDWHSNIAQRNREILAGLSQDYYLDQGLMEKFLSLYEPPSPEEMHVVYHFCRA